MKCKMFFMLSQTATLDVKVPPNIDSERSSSGVEVNSGGMAKLECYGDGYPEPVISWKRADGNKFKAKDHHGLVKSCKLLTVFYSLLRTNQIMKGLFNKKLYIKSIKLVIN